jgi:poly(A) polymerase
MNAKGNLLLTELTDLFRRSRLELYLVGGAVRDRLLEIYNYDLDFATSAKPAQTITLLRALGRGEPYRVGEKFGTVGLRAGAHTMEITTYRSRELYEPHSRKPQVEFGESLEEDLARRDFTINAMALDPLTGELFDPFGGRKDLESRLLRAVGNPQDRFREDPLRLLRAVRFSSRLDFSIAPETWGAMCASSPALEHVSRERIRDEYSKILEGPNPVRGLVLLRDSDLMAHSVPELLELTRMLDHGPRHPLSLWEHTMLVVAGTPPSLIVRWAALLHDIAKPATRTHEPDGRPRFFHHEELGAEMARKILSGLRYPTETVEDVSLLVQTHMQIHAYTSEWSDGAIRRLMLRLGRRFGDAVTLARADGAGHNESGISWNSPRFDALEQRAAELGHTNTAGLSSPLDGNELMARYHRPPGPWIREIKDKLLDEVLEGRLEPENRVGAWEIADLLIGHTE